MQSRVRLLTALLLALVVAVTASACGSDSLHSAMGHDDSAMSHDSMMDGDGTTHSAAQMGTGRNADVMFTQEMIPHHQQAVAMADLALDPAHEASSQVQDLARRIKAAQAREITAMQSWLGEWNVADGGDQVGTGTGAAGMDAHGMSGMGMMSAAQMTALENATGAAFDKLWLEGMILHHEGALTMASHIAHRGSDARVHDLSGAITASQMAEIAEMRKLLGQ